jgi:TolA-binding protein
VQLFQEVVTGFRDVPQVVAEVALAQGRLAEARGEAEAAATAYGLVLEHVEPGPGEAGVAGAVMDLPLQIARLRAQAAGDSIRARESFYVDPRATYQSWIDAYPATLVEMEARIRLADVAADLGDWDTSLGILRDLETDLASEDPPLIDPARIRFGIANLYRLTNDQSAHVATLESLVDDFPESAIAARSLLMLAGAASAEQGVVSLEEALDHLNRLQNDFPGAEQLLARGQLMRGRLLERNDRWGEAHNVYLALPVQYPLSEEALLSHVDIVSHYRRVSDEDGLKAALSRAEREYRDFLSKYPSAPTALSARIKLAQVLVLQKRYDEAITHLVDIEDAVTGTPQGAYLLGQAAQMAFTALGDSARALEVLDRVAERYQNTGFGSSASNEAARLREAGGQ